MIELSAEIYDEAVFPMDGWVCGYPSNPSINYEMDIHP